MKMTPKIVEGNVNVSKTHPLKELITLLAGVIGITVGIYIVLGLSVDVAVKYMPTSVENSLAEFFSTTYGDSEVRTPQELAMQDLLDELKSVTTLSDQKIRVSVHSSPMSNAFAFPGYRIVVFSGLIEAAESENEIAMVLGHELGHFANKDHLRGMGRSLVLLVISSVILGDYGGVTEIIQTSLSATDMKFSQRQETQADEYGLLAVEKFYGHAGGSMAFFDRIDKESESSVFTGYFSTHPHPGERVKTLNNLISKRKYAVKTLKKLSYVFLENGKEKKKDINSEK